MGAMADRVHVDRFRQKIDLVLARHPSVTSHSSLAKSIHVTKDYISRVISGSRGLTSDVLDDISQALGVDRSIWMLDIESFATKLGLSRDALVDAGVLIPGFDFLARIRDPHHVRQLHSLIGGYWESYYYSVSRRDVLVASRDLVFFGEPDHSNVLPCTVTDTYFTYRGWCFPVQHHVYMMLEKERILNEIIVYMLNTPQRIPPRLEGIILCKSDGEDAFSSMPCAARVGLRFLGSSIDLMRARGLHDAEELHAALVAEVAGYVRLEDLDNDAQRDLFKRVANVIAEDQLPNALRMSPDG